MTVKEAVERDSVGMRWVRTAATTVTAVAGALVVVWATVVWTVGPRVNAWANDLIDDATKDLQIETSKSAAHLDRLDKVVERLEKNVTALGEAVAQNVAPSWRFSLPDTSISDGRIGGKVTITAGGYKLRECGIPRVDLYFINGGGAYHRFVKSSLLSETNRGVALPMDPDRLQIISYTAEIPADDGVSPGRGHGYISVTYPDNCPGVREETAGPLQFRILPNG